MGQELGSRNELAVNILVEESEKDDTYIYSNFNGTVLTLIRTRRRFIRLRLEISVKLMLVTLGALVFALGLITYSLRP